MDQHRFVKERLAFYEEQGLIPGNPDDGDWDECHYPEPEGVGSRTIPMLHNDHQQQGLYQSEEYGYPCFFNGDAKRFLDNNWCSNWFELYDLYDKWSGYYTTAMNNHENTKRARVANASAMNSHPNTVEVRRKNAEKSRARDSKKVKCSTGFIHPSASEASRVTGINRGHICECCRGERRTAGGYTWSYLG